MVVVKRPASPPQPVNERDRNPVELLWERECSRGGIRGRILERRSRPGRVRDLDDELSSRNRQVARLGRAVEIQRRAQNGEGAVAIRRRLCVLDSDLKVACRLGLGLSREREVTGRSTAVLEIAYGEGGRSGARHGRPDENSCHSVGCQPGDRSPTSRQRVRTSCNGITRDQ